MEINLSIKSYIRKNTGITLIALVVTIIVLIILTGISISMLTGQNGILNRALEAKYAQEEATLYEQIQLILVDAITKNTVEETNQ